tara:strand:+ start:557 stop:931 length:375 start_codon:yes stop_codon:yes gene_type:complete
MSHTNSPEYFTISTVCQYDGTTNVLAICEDIDAVMYRLKQCYTSCGDEYRINCYHLTTASDAAEKYNEQVISSRKYKAQQKEVEDKLKAYDQLPDADKQLAEELASHDTGEDLALLAYETKYRS